jgi:Beta protein
VINLAQTLYAPLLGLKPAELTAYSELAGPEKIRMLPIFRFRPWLSSKSLSSAIDRLVSATDSFPAATIIDTSWTGTNRTREATIEFAGLLNDLSRESFVQLFRQIPHILPCLSPKQEELSFLSSPNAGWLVERGFGIVLRLKDTAQHGNLLEFVTTTDHSNYFVLVDCGWSRDPTLSAVSAINLIRNLLDANNGLNLFVSSSSFPDSFGGINGQSDVPLLEIDLFDQISSVIRSRYNNATLKYSDWATTRPPNNGGGGAAPPRIDLPLLRQISVHRDAPRGTIPTDYTDLAQAAFRRNPWSNPPQCWGHNCLNLSALGAQGGVDNLQKNTASRANIHMHNTILRLAGGPVALDEPFTL